MRTLGANFTAELAKETASFVLLLDLELTTPVYYTTCDIPVVTGGNRYLPLDFTVEGIPAASGLEVGNVDISAASVDQTLAALLLGEDVAGAGVLLRAAALDANHRVVQDATPADIVVNMFRGFLASYELDEMDVTINVANELILWSKKTLRKCQASCPWPFKGTECGYSGSESWCDQSYTRCTQLSNTDSYGGFRYIAATMEKEIRWGRY